MYELFSVVMEKKVEKKNFLHSCFLKTGYFWGRVCERSITFFPVQPWENFCNVYCFTTNQMWDVSAKDNRQTAALFSHVLTRNNELVFSSTRNLQFFRLKYWNFSFSILALLEYIWMKFYGKAVLDQEDRISRSDTARQLVWAREKWANHKQCSSVFVSRAVQKIMLLGCDWWFSIGFFFVAEKPLPMTRTCTVVNFHNFHGQFGSLVFEQTESSD